MTQIAVPESSKQTTCRADKLSVTDEMILHKRIPKVKIKKLQKSNKNENKSTARLTRPQSHCVSMNFYTVGIALLKM